jgi:VWFA-related protein
VTSAARVPRVPGEQDLTSAFFRLLAATTLVLLALATPGAQQRPPGTPSEQPTFRAGVNLVRVDVSVTGRNEEAVADLDASNFLVTEDDVSQKVETAQFIRLNGRPDDSGRDLTIRDRDRGLAEAEKEDVRLFALFLDDYHIDSHPAVAIRLKRTLESFVDSLQPTDLVVVMDPLTTLDGLVFTRDKWQLRERIRTFKGRRGELVPVRSAVEEAQLTQSNVWELRAGVTLSALEALVTHLGGLREGRKSVVFVSQGPPVGRPGSLVYPRLESVLQAANRGNVTVHVLDPRPLGSAPFGGAEALARLSADTGGRAIINSNTPWDRIEQVFSDASAYYLIGYSPAHDRTDGRFHRIEVGVNRPGVHVTARRGYWAPPPEDLSASPRPTPDPALSRALEALASLGKGRPIDVWIGSAPSADQRTEVQLAWEALAHARQGVASVLEVEPLTRGGAASGAPQTIAASGNSSTSVARFLLEPGQASLRMTVRSADGSELDRWTDRLVVPDYSDAGVELGTPRVYRTRSPLEARRFDAGGESVPVVSRRFGRTDRLVIDVPWTARSGAPDLSARLTGRDGSTLMTLPLSSSDQGRARIVLPLTSLAPSTYLVRVDATSGDEHASQQVAFTVSQ